MKGSLKRGRAGGEWYLRVELPREPSGRRTRRRFTVRGTKAEAERKLRDLLREVETDSLPTERLAMAVLCERWLQSREHRVCHRTFAAYRAHVRLYITPALGALRVDSIRSVHLETALAAWRRGPRNDRQHGVLSTRTVAHIFNTLRSLCRWGVKTGVLARNPTETVEPPRFVPTEMRALDANGIRGLLAAAHGSELEDAIIIALGTGLRRGELLALRWTDIDFNSARLTVRRSLEKVEGEIRAKPPKTARSARTLALTTFVINALRRRRAAQVENRLLLGLGRSDDDWIFTRRDGKLWDPGEFSLAFARLVKRARIPHVRFHDLRHSFGTLVLASGVDLKTVSTALGHSTIATTANVYLHAVPSLEHDAAARLDAMLGSIVGDPIAAPIKALPKRSGPRWAHTGLENKGKPRQIRPELVAPTGIESEEWGPGRFRRLPKSPVL